MKLFVWENVLWDYSHGLVCVLADDLEQAHTLLAEKYPEYADQIPGLPERIVEAPEAFAVHGGS